MTPSAPDDLVQYRAQSEVQVTANLPTILEISARLQIAQPNLAPQVRRLSRDDARVYSRIHRVRTIGCEEQRIEDLTGAHRAQRHVSKRMPKSSWLPALSTVLRLRFWVTE